MTTIPVSAVPAPGPHGRPAHIQPGSLDRIPGSDANLPPAEKLTPAELDSISTEANAFAGRLMKRIAAFEDQIEAAHAEAEARYKERDMPQSLRKQRATEDAAHFRKQIVAQTAAERAELLQAVRDREARVMAQKDFYRSAVAVLQSHAFNSESIKLAPAMAGAGVAGLLQAWRDSFSQKQIWLGAALLSRVGSLTDDQRSAMAAAGYDSKALAERLLGESFAIARESFKRVELGLDAAENADRAFETGKADLHANIRAGLKNGDYEGHRDPSR